MSRKIFFPLVVILILMAGFLRPAAPARATAPQAPAQVSAFDLIIAMNTLRVSLGNSALIEDPIIDAVAQATAQTMAANNMSWHIGDVRGRIQAAGYGGGAQVWATENFAVGTGMGIDQIMVIWSDPTHMLPATNPAYCHIGAGVAQADNGRIYYVLQAAYTSGQACGANNYNGGGTSGGGTGSNGGNGGNTTPQYIYPVKIATPDADGKIYHTVEFGQSFWSIAIAYQITIADLEYWNNLSRDEDLWVGQKLFIPTKDTEGYATPTPVGMVILATPDADGKIVHEVQSYQTLSSISAAYNVSLTSLLNFNGWQEDWPLQIGQKIVVSPGKILSPLEQLTPNADGNYYHTVTSGETLFGIATAYGLTLETLLNWNGLNNTSIIFPGEKLLLPVTPPPPPPPPRPPHQHPRAQYPAARGTRRYHLPHTFTLLSPAVSHPRSPYPFCDAHPFRPSALRQYDGRHRHPSRRHRHPPLGNDPQKSPRRGIIMTTRQERIAGGLWGLLVGDAVGVPYEFHAPHELPPRAQLELLPPPNFARAHARIPPGTWSDDGAQALALLASLITNKALHLEDFAQRLLNWYQRGDYAVDHDVFDVGIQTRQALDALARGIPPTQSGPNHERANGNGSLMRVLPLALWHAGPDADLVHAAHQQSLVTHGHLRAQVCCALYCLWARHLLEASPTPWQDAVTTLRALYGPDSSAHLELEHLRPDDPPTGHGSGYVVDCLHSARLALQADTYEEVIQTAIALGNDTDTTACVAGGLAGIREGVRAIPARWLDALRGKEIVQLLLEKLLNAN